MTQPSTPAGGAPPRRSLPARFAAAFRLNAALYDEIEHDPGALPQAALVVLAGGLARGLFAFPQEGLVGLVGSVIAAVVLWFSATAAVTGIGVRLFHGTSSFEELLRTMGFAAAPLCILVLGLVPVEWLQKVVWFAGHGLAVAALVVAVRQALDTDTRRALAVCAGALAAGIALVVLVGLLFFGRAAY